VVTSSKEPINGNTLDQHILDNMEEGIDDTLYTQDEIQDLIQELRGLVSDLGFEYERLSRSGKDTYDEICELLDIE